MDTDDLFSELDGANVRAGGRFQPKAKRQPKKATKKVISTIPNDPEKKDDTQSLEAPMAIQHVEIGDNGLSVPKDAVNSYLLGVADALPSEVVAEGNNHSSLGVLMTEADTARIDLDSSSNLKAASNSGGNSNEVDMDSQPVKDLLTTYAVNTDLGCSDSPTESATLSVSTNLDLGKSVCGKAEAPGAPASLDYSLTQDQARWKDSTLSGSDGDTQMENGRVLTEEEADTFTDLGTLDVVPQVATTSGMHNGKFQPKPKLKPNIQSGETRISITIPDLDPVVSTMDEPNSQIVDEPNSQFVDEPENPVQSFIDYSVGAGTNSDPDYVVEAEACSGTDNDEEVVKQKPKKNKSVSKSEKEKLPRKRKNPDHSTKEPQKKFRHSTRRKRRCVTAELLQTADEEMTSLPIKDILLLADYHERLAKKEAKSSKNVSTDQSTEKNTCLDEDFEDDEFRDEEETRNQEGYGVQSSSFLFNYQSYMKKEPRSKWSKQDTELFYEAIQQFGTDLSMIQQLFPGKSRHQIKLKYKKEERQQPLRLSEALVNRSKDHCHFEKVIEHLKQVAAEAGEELKEDRTDEVEELIPETNNEKSTKVEKNEGPTVEEANVVEDLSNDLELDESEGEVDDELFSSYVPFD